MSFQRPPAALAPHANINHRFVRPERLPKSGARLFESAGIEQALGAAPGPPSGLAQKINSDPQELPGHARILLRQIKKILAGPVLAADKFPGWIFRHNWRVLLELVI